MSNFFAKKPDKRQTSLEEASNSISHAIGLGGAVLAAPILIHYAASHILLVSYFMHFPGVGFPILYGTFLSLQEPHAIL